MLFHLAAYEFRTRMRQMSTHVYALILFALAFLVMNALGGAFGSGNVIIMGMGPNTHVNGPFVIGLMTFFLSFIGVVITAPFMGQAIFRDFDSGIHPLIFTTPVTKAQYLGGRFLGSIAAHLYLYAAMSLGLFLGTVVPWVDAARMGDAYILAYLQPYIVFVLPNLLFTGALFFALPAVTRKMLPNYIGGVLLLMGYNIASILMEADAILNSALAGLLDPFGQIPASEVTRYWTVAEQNSQMIPLEGTLLWNRLLWMGLGLAILGAMYARFRFAHQAGGNTRSGNTETEADAPASLAELSPTSLIRSVTVPSVSLSTGTSIRWKQFWTLTKRSFLEIVRDVYFYAIVAASIIFLVVAAAEAGKQYGTAVYPLTYHVLDALNAGFSLFMLILITFYAGQLVWKERDVEANQIHDTLPLPGSLSFLAKTTALGGMCAVLLAVVGVTGVITQFAYGFSDIDLGLYALDLFAVEWVSYLLLCILAVTVQAVVNHKYLGHFVMVLYFLLSAFGGQIGLEHNLWTYRSDPGMPYSDLNGYGHFAMAYVWHTLLWAGVAVGMAVLARLAWVRGMETTLAARWHTLKTRTTPRLLGALAIGGALAFGTGAYVYVNTSVWNTFRTSDESEAVRADYEKTYARYADLPTPRVTAVDLDVDLMPTERNARFAGTYTLLNDTGVPVDSVFLSLNQTLTVDTLAFGRPSETVRTDATHGVRILRLAEPLAPGDSTTLTFALRQRNRGFTNDGSNTALVHNGTFIQGSSVLPAMGYADGAELSDNDTREEYGLEPKPRMAALEDSTARMRPYIGSDATWIRYEATVTTDADQTALAPGTLDSTWTEGDRRTFRYRTTGPTLNFQSFLSARYAVTDDVWTPTDSLNRGQDVGVEIYYHPEHDYNVDRMVEAVKHSLDYYTRHFGPYQSEQVRIAEFPRYASFAQSFLGTIPYSESIGFIARVDDESDIDFPYYVTAHEMAHQWWGHQIVGGEMQGSTMLVETLSQYSALMVMEEAYGRQAMKRFLEYELDRYLMGRSGEQEKELPLMRVENQGYVHYRKGSLVMYALKDYLGEATVNRVLREFLEAHRFTEPPFPTSEMLVERFEAAAPDSLKGFVGDLFREITLYDNRATEATVTETDDGRYRVDLTVTARKLQADSLGSETEVAMDHPVAIGLFASEADVSAEEQEVLYLEKHALTGGEQTITITVDKRPARAGIDPFVTLVDRNTSDNLTSVEAGDS